MTIWQFRSNFPPCSDLDLFQGFMVLFDLFYFYFYFIFKFKFLFSLFSLFIIYIFIF